MVRIPRISANQIAPFAPPSHTKQFTHRLGTYHEKTAPTGPWVAGQEGEHTTIVRILFWHFAYVLRTILSRKTVSVTSRTLEVCSQYGQKPSVHTHSGTVRHCRGLQPFVQAHATPARSLRYDHQETRNTRSCHSRTHQQVCQRIPRAVYLQAIVHEDRHTA